MFSPLGFYRNSISFIKQNGKLKEKSTYDSKYSKLTLDFPQNVLTFLDSFVKDYSFYYKPENHNNKKIFMFEDRKFKHIFSKKDFYIFQNIVDYLNNNHIKFIPELGTFQDYENDHSLALTISFKIDHFNFILFSRIDEECLTFLFNFYLINNKI